MTLLVHFSPFATIAVLRGMEAKSARTTHLSEFVTEEVYNSGGGCFVLFCFLNRAPSDEWECLCNGKQEKTM